MKRDDTFSDNGAPPTPAPEHGGDSEGYGLSSPPITAQDTLCSAHLPRIARRLTSHRRMPLLLVATVGVVLVAMAGGYGSFRALSQPSRQASPALEATHWPF